MVHNGSPYLVAPDEAASAMEVAVYAIDLQTAGLTRIFVGGSRNPAVGGVWTIPSGRDLILVSVADSGIVALDAPLALEVVQSMPDSQ